MNIKLLIAAVLLVILCFLVVVVRAADEVNPIDQYFETVRGQLLAVYNSEIISHAGIILGLIIALPPIGQIAWRRLRSQRLLARLFAVSVFLLVGMLILYGIGGLFYWSTLAGALMGATRSELGVNITGSNVTSCMHALNSYTEDAFMNSTFTNNPNFSWTNSLAQNTRPGITYFWVFCFLVFILSVTITITLWQRTHRKRRYKQKTLDLYEHP